MTSHQCAGLPKTRGTYRLAEDDVSSQRQHQTLGQAVGELLQKHECQGLLSSIHHFSHAVLQGEDEGVQLLIPVLCGAGGAQEQWDRWIKEDLGGQNQFIHFQRCSTHYVEVTKIQDFQSQSLLWTPDVYNQPPTGSLHLDVSCLWKNSSPLCSSLICALPGSW